MRKIIEYSVRNPVFANMLILILLIITPVTLLTIERQMFPQFSLDSIFVNVPYPSATPEEVEEGICLKIEDAIDGIDGVKKYTTKAKEGLGSAVIEVKSGADVQVVKDDITDQINAITTFPPDAEKPSVFEAKRVNMTLGIALYGDLPENQMKELAEDLREELKQDPQITRVSVQGARRYEIALELSEERLRQYGVSFDEVSQIVRTASQNFSGGVVKSDREEIQIRTMGRRYTGEDYAKIVVITRPDGTVIRLGDVATITDAFEEDDQLNFYNTDLAASPHGVPALTIQVFNSNDEDALKISDAVKAWVAIKEKELPSNVNFHIFSDRSIPIRARINLMKKSGLYGFILVFIMLWFFLDLRLAFWVGLGIPISISAAICLMPVFDQSINMLSLFAFIMILGIVVDDAIVIGESIYHERLQGSPPIKAAIDGSMKVAWPVIAAIITNIIAFSPLLVVGGVMGKFMRIIPAVVILCLAVSLIEALIILPAHLNNLPQNDHDPTNKGAIRAFFIKIRARIFDGVQGFIDKIYAPVCKFFIEFRYIAFAGTLTILILVVGLISAGFIKTRFMPDLESDDLEVSLEFPAGTPSSVTEKAIRQIETSLAELQKESKTVSGKPLVKSAFARVGGAGTRGNAQTGAHLGEIRASLIPSEERGLSSRKLAERWQELTGPIPGSISQVFQTRQNGPGGKAIEIWLLGDSLERLLNASKDIRKELATKKGVYQIEDDYRPGRRELRATLKPEARTLGLTTADLGRQLRQGFYGDESVRIQRGRDDIRVKIRYPKEQRRLLSDVENMRIRTQMGNEIPLLSVADIAIERGYNTINRKDGKRRLRILAEVKRSVANADEILNELQFNSQTTEVTDASNSTTGLNQTKPFLVRMQEKYPEIIFSLEGEKADNRESLGSLAITFPLAMLGIFMVLALVFRSYIQPLVIMFTIPFGIIGAILGHFFMGFSISMMSFFGIIALTGIVVNDAIVLIEAINHNLSEGMKFKDSVVEAGKRRFRAVMLTTFTTCGGLLPLILEKDFQAQFLIPMALAIAAGVMFATMLTLLLIPSLICILNDVRGILHYLKTGDWLEREAVEPATFRNVLKD